MEHHGERKTRFLGQSVPNQAHFDILGWLTVSTRVRKERRYSLASDLLLFAQYWAFTAFSSHWVPVLGDAWPEKRHIFAVLPGLLLRRPDEANSTKSSSWRRLFPLGVTIGFKGGGRGSVCSACSTADLTMASDNSSTKSQKVVLAIGQSGTNHTSTKNCITPCQLQGSRCDGIPLRTMLHMHGQ